MSRYDKQGDVEKGRNIPAPKSIRTKGLRIEKYLNDKKIFSAKIGYLRTNKQKMGFFSINPFDILEIDNVQVNLYESDLKTIEGR